jgi:hypothetical protein
MQVAREFQENFTLIMSPDRLSRAVDEELRYRDVLLG